MRARTIATSALTLLLLAGTAHAKPEGKNARQSDRPAARQTQRAQPAPRASQPRQTTRAATSTTRAVRPTTRPVTPPTRAVRPTTRPATPTTRAVTPTTRAIMPSTRAITPDTRPITPTVRPIAPTTRPIEPTTRAITPTTRPATSDRPATTMPRPSNAPRTFTRPDTAANRNTNPPRESRPAVRPDTRPTNTADRPAATRPVTRPQPGRAVRPDTRPSNETDAGRTSRPNARPDRPTDRTPDRAPNRASGRATNSDGIRIEPLPNAAARPDDRTPGDRTPNVSRPGNADNGRAVNRPVTIDDRVRSRPAPEIHQRLEDRAASRGRPATRPGGPGMGHDDPGDLVNPRHGDHHNGGDHHDGHHDNHHDGWHDHHYHYTHGYCYDFWDYSWGIWIGYRWSDWYYCPPYRTRTYVYVSPTYVDHYYFGAGTGSDADYAVTALEAGWHALERGQYTTARHHFADASRRAPDWGLPKIGYGLSLAAVHNGRAALPLLRRAFADDPYAALEVPWSPEIEQLLIEMDARYTNFAEQGRTPDDSWFLASVMRLLLNDADAAADAAFNAQACGDRSRAIDGLLDVLAGSPSALPSN